MKRDAEFKANIVKGTDSVMPGAGQDGEAADNVTHDERLPQRNKDRSR